MHRLLEDHIPRVMKIISFLALISAAPAGAELAVGPGGSTKTASPTTKIAPWLASRLERGGEVEMLVLLDHDTDLGRAGGMGSRSEKGRYIYDSLRGAALASQGPLISWLRSRGVVVKPFWIVNAVLLKGDLGLARQIESRREVRALIGNPTVYGLGDFDRGGERIRTAPTASADGVPAAAGSDGSGLAKGVVGAGPLPVEPQSVEWGVHAIHADDVWSQKNVRGEGIVVASMDTGVEWTHPAIKAKYRGWNGSTADHSYSWHDSIEDGPSPIDDNDHGTHTTGTMVGDDGGGNQIGVAPNAKWVACRNMDHGNGTPARYLECMQWGLAPYPPGGDPFRDGRPDLAPDITNNSWGCPPSEGCDANSLRQALENIRASGQMTVAAAGNDGPLCTTVQDPPAIYDAVFTAGAVDSSIRLANFSSKGPVTVDGSNRLKPEIAAPGVNVRSSVRGGGYASFSGTSMASPHTAGALALLWSAKPNLEQLNRISRCYMEQPAGIVTNGSGTVGGSCGGTRPADHPNNLWGYGLVDALGAINFGPDGDGDGIADACDCDSHKAGIFDSPPEIVHDGFSDRQTYQWNSLSSLAGSATAYDVVRGQISQLRADRDFRSATCKSNNTGETALLDAQLPPPGDAYYYLVRGQNSCGDGSYGSDSGGSARSVPGCS